MIQQLSLIHTKNHQCHYLNVVCIDIDTQDIQQNILKHFYSADIMALFWNNPHNNISLRFVYILFLLFSIVLSHSIAYLCTVYDWLALAVSHLV